MRIVLTCNFSPWSPYSGGGQRSTHNLACALCARGHHVTVVFTKSPLERITAPTDLPYQLRWAALPGRISRVNAPLRHLTAVTVRSAVARELTAGAQVIHANGEEAALLPGLKRAHRFALVVTPRYPSLPQPLASGLVSPLDWLHLSIMQTKYVALGAALRGADAVSPPSHFAGRLMQRAYHLSDEQMRPVHNGVPAEFLNYAWQPAATSKAPSEPAPASDGRPVFFFGRFASDKGIDTLLEALQSLGDRAPQAVLAGRGPLKRDIEQQIERSGRAGAIRAVDWMSHDELGRQLTHSSMAVIPSREENFSLAVLSAMAVGTPLITTPVGGTPEVMRHGQTGRLFPASDAQALAAAIEANQADPITAAAMAQTGRNEVRAHFTWQTSAEKFEHLYEQILKP